MAAASRRFRCARALRHWRSGAAANAAQYAWAAGVVARRTARHYAVARLAAWALWAARTTTARRRREAARGLGLLRLARGADAFFGRAREARRGLPRLDDIRLLPQAVTQAVTVCIQARRAERLASITHVHACKAALASAVWHWAWRRRAAVARRGAALAVARRRRLGGLAVVWGRLRLSARVAALRAAATCAARRRGLGRWRARAVARRAVALGVELGARWQRRLAFNAWQCGRPAQTPLPDPPPHPKLTPNQNPRPSR